MDYANESASVKTLYEKMDQDRAPYLDRAREVSKLTLPFLMPPAGHTSTATLPTPWTNMGARGVNNLASKMLLTLIPPSPFFRLSIDNQTLAGLDESGQLRSQLEEKLMVAEQAIVREIEKSSIRPVIYEAFRHLIVAGNCLLFVNEEGVRSFGLDQYVIHRDPMGNVEKIITKAVIGSNQLDPKVLARLKTNDPGRDEDTHELYTCIKAKGKKFDVFQSVSGVIIEDSIGSYTEASMPYIALRWNLISGASYGRGLGEEVLGDLKTSAGLIKALVEGTAASAKVLFLVSPNGSTRARQLAESENGAILQGNANDVSVVRVDKHSDFRVALETIRMINTRLEHNFLLTQSVTRDAERVTAREIDVLKENLDAALGGTFSQLSQSFQLPLVKRMMHMMTKSKALPAMPKELVSPVITTGLESLGRTHDLAKLDAFIGGVIQTMGPQMVQQYVNVGDYLKRRAAALGINTKGLIKTEEQVSQETQQAQQMQMAQKLGGPAIESMTKQSMAAQEQEQGAAEQEQETPEAA